MWNEQKMLFVRIPIWVNLQGRYGCIKTPTVNLRTDSDARKVRPPWPFWASLQRKEPPKALLYKPRSICCDVSEAFLRYQMVSDANVFVQSRTSRTSVRARIWGMVSLIGHWTKSPWWLTIFSARVCCIFVPIMTGFRALTNKDRTRSSMQETRWCSHVFTLFAYTVLL